MRATLAARFVIALAALAGGVSLCGAAPPGTCSRDDSAASAAGVAALSPDSAPLRVAISAELGRGLLSGRGYSPDVPESTARSGGFRVDGPRHGAALALVRARALRVLPLWTGHSMSLFVGLDPHGRPGLQFAGHDGGGAPAVASLTELPRALSDFLR